MATRRAENRWASKSALVSFLIAAFALLGSSPRALAETDDAPYSSDIEGAPAEDTGAAKALPPKPTEKKKDGPKEKRKYFIEDTERVDAGIFHVAFAAGGNFYLEPKLDATTRLPNGEYFKDFGFQAGIVFDYDYSALTENVPLGLRGMIGYKYILSSVHVFTIDAIARYISRVSSTSNFGLGAGVSAAIWFRSITSTSTSEETIFLPSLILSGGFDFNPFMVELKWLMNRIGSDSTITGFELYFGVRL